jgi:hypothetical protein
MSNKLKETKAKIKAKIESVKRINDDPEKAVDSLFDKYAKDLPSTDKLFGKTLTDFTSKLKPNKENNKDVFADLIDTVEGFLGSNKKFEGAEKEFSKQRLKQITSESIHKTIGSSKQIITDSVNKVLFVGDGICGIDKRFGSTPITLSPSEFDFMNVLTVDPNSSSGKIVYEPQSPDRGSLKVNRMLYSGFTSNQTYVSKDGTTLFNTSWDTNTQKYTVSGLQGVGTVQNFMNQYYNSIEHIDMTGVTKTAMLMTLQGSSDDPPLFDKGFNDLNRLLSKICAACGNPPVPGANQNTSTQFNENDEDYEAYFDFESLEGIDIDDEDNRYKKVLKFKDCNEFKIPVDTTHIEDFVYLSNGDLNKSVANALLNAAADAHSASDSSIPLDNFHISITNSFILNLPKALIGTVLAPKYMLPIVVAYKGVIDQVSSTALTAKDIMKKLAKLFNEIIRGILWKFISEFWALVKKDLLAFLQKLVLKILKNKTKRYYVIVTALIALLTALLESGLADCSTLYGLLNKAIDMALKGGNVSIPIPGILLGLSHHLPGFSQDRAYMNITQRLEAGGISMGQVFGEDNNLSFLVKSVIDGHTEEHDANGYIAVSSQEINLTKFGVPVIIPPGILNSSGKSF